MKRSIFKPIAFGLLIGAAAFFAPFMILKVMCFFFIIGGIMRLIFWGRFRGGRPQYYMAYADKIRNMSEEEYGEFKNKINNKNDHCCYGTHNHCDEKQKNN